MLPHRGQRSLLLDSASLVHKDVYLIEYMGGGVAALSESRKKGHLYAAFLSPGKRLGIAGDVLLISVFSLNRHPLPGMIKHQIR